MACSSYNIYCSTSAATLAIKSIQQISRGATFFATLIQNEEKKTLWNR